MAATTSKRSRQYRHWVPYELAKHVIQNGVQRPSSRTQYRKWHDRNNPIAIPKYPERCYKDRWNGWNDYLGNDNEFVRNAKKHCVWRNYWEAMRYVHSLNLTTREQYIEARNKPDWPQDIPATPHEAYSEWVDYPTWLGVTLRTRVENIANISKCVALCNIQGQADNMVKVVTGERGIDDLKQRVKVAGDLSIFKLYKYNTGEDLRVMKLILQANAFDHGDSWLVPNLNQLLFELDNHLEWWRG